MERIIKIALAASLLSSACGAFAGVDLSGPVTRVEVWNDGTIYFGISNGSIATYCKDHWNQMPLYIPATDPNYAYDYGILLMSLSKAKSIYLGNISIFDGTTPCDATKSGYGLTILQ